MRLLIVEDDSRLLTQLDSYFQKKGFSTDLADNGIDALHQLTQYPYDAAIVDIGLPGRDGLDVIQQARKNQISVPVLILTARDRWQDKVEGLDAGADDYVTKPFHNEELLSRVKALIRRASGNPSPVLNIGPVELDMVQQSVMVNAKPLTLTSYEYRVLEYLMLNPQKVISKSELTEHIYDQDFDLDSNVIEVFIGRLRKKIDPSGKLKFIETLRGRGYRINADL